MPLELNAFLHYHNLSSHRVLSIPQSGRRNFPLLPLPSLPFPSHFQLFPSLPLEVGPLNPAIGFVLSSPSEVWGGAPAEIEFGAF